jgi:hypothetical protein
MFKIHCYHLDLVFYFVQNVKCDRFQPFELFTGNYVTHHKQIVEAVINSRRAAVGYSLLSDKWLR